jgi:hypothetical protein
MGQVVEEFGKREGVSDQGPTDAVSNPNRHRQAGRVVRDGLNQASPFALGKADRRSTRDPGVQDVFERQTLLPPVIGRSRQYRKMVGYPQRVTPILNSLTLCIPTSLCSQAQASVRLENER